MLLPYRGKFKLINDKIYYDNRRLNANWYHKVSYFSVFVFQTSIMDKVHQNWKAKYADFGKESRVTMCYHTYNSALSHRHLWQRTCQTWWLCAVFPTDLLEQEMKKTLKKKKKNRKKRKPMEVVSELWTRGKKTVREMEMCSHMKKMSIDLKKKYFAQNICYQITVDSAAIWFFLVACSSLFP